MRHRKAVVKLNRTPSHRKAMFRNMVTSLFKHERIQTTGAKAKELRRWADHLITLAKRGDLHARRQALSIVREKDVVHKLFEQATERFGAVSGGYTRVVKLGRRAGDAAPISLVELVVLQDTKKKKTKKKKTKTDAVPKKAAADKKSVTDGKTVSKEQEKPQKSTKKTVAPADKEDKSAAKAKKSTEEKAEDPVEGDTKPAKAKSVSKKKVAGEEKEVKAATDAPPKKKAAAEKDKTSDTKQKKESAKKTDKGEE